MGILHYNRKSDIRVQIRLAKIITDQTAKELVYLISVVYVYFYAFKSVSV